jgi:hypothetical protein
MTSNTIYHYVYRITNLVEKKHYYGKRSSKCDPKLDLGKIYFSSSLDESFKLDQKKNPQNYRYKVVQSFQSGKEAIIREAILHHKFDVGANPRFYNKTKQTPNGFDSSRSVTVKDLRTNKNFVMSMEDFEKSEDNIVGASSGSLNVKNLDTGETFRMLLSDFYSLDKPNNIVSARKGTIISKESRLKMRKPRSEEGRANIKAGMKPKTDLQRKVISKNRNLTNQINRVCCLITRKEYDLPNFVRWCS